MTFTLTLLHGADQESARQHYLDMLAGVPAGEMLLNGSRHDISDKAARPAAWEAIRTPPLPIVENPTRWVFWESVDTIKDAETLKFQTQALEAAEIWAKGRKQHLQLVCLANEEVGANPTMAPIMVRVKKKNSHLFSKIAPWQYGEQLAAAKAAAEEMGLELRTPVIAELVRLTAGDQAKIRHQLQKLGPLLAAGEKVTVPKLRVLVGQPTVTTRDLVAAARDGRKGLLLELAEQMLASGEKAWDVAGWLATQLHPLLLCVRLAGDADQQDLAKLLNKKKGQIWALTKDLPPEGPGCDLLKLCTALVAFREAITRGEHQGHRQQGEALLLTLAEGVS